MPDILRRPDPPAIRSFTAPRRHDVVAGPGALGTLGTHLERLGAARAFLLTGRSLAEGTPLVDRAREAGAGRIGGVFPRISAHTPLSDLVAALDAARDAGADAIVSLGGGAVMDAGKYAVTCLSLGLDSAESIRAFLAAQKPDPAPIPGMLPQIAIPTTASAAEFTRVAGILDEEARAKRRLDHPQIVPDVIIQDPEAVLHTPPDLWLSSAVRTLDHAVEGLYGPRATPWSDAMGKEAIRLLARGLPACHAAPDDLAAIADVQAATWLGASCGNTAGTGLSHGLGYLLGAKFGVPHGHCSCVTLRHVAEWMRPAAEGPLAEVARALKPSLASVPEAEAADAAPALVGALIGGLGQPVRARDVGVPDRTALLALAPAVLRLPHVPGSPRQPRNEDEARELLDAMW
ncbi:MAG: iron-containing alcohol dehydrogenase [Pseudooceanicola sp.]